MEAVFVDKDFQEFYVYSIVECHELNIHVLLEMCENRENYVPQKFGHMRYVMCGMRVAYR